MKVLFVASEAVPFAKTGGLADVAGALPLALQKTGQEVRVMMPKYKRVDKFNLEDELDDLMVPLSNRYEPANVKTILVDKKVPFHFIENNRYYNREELYGTSSGDYEDNAERFVFFCRAVLEACKALNFQPDIIHCNDWQTGLIPIYLKTLYKDDPFFKYTGSIFTYHNIAYQGNFWYLDMHLTGLSWDYFTPEGIEFFEKISMMKAGLNYSDIINTVSPTYSRETQTEEYGYKLEGVLAKRKNKLYGILNGIDYSLWNPATDRDIASKYSYKNVKGKGINKADLQSFFELPVNGKIPVIGIVSRLADQKGFDILEGAMEGLMKLNLQIVVLGVGEDKYHSLLLSLKSRYSDKIGVKIGFDNKVAKMIYAGSDMFLMPSKYEPCGIGQLISFRYGTVPIVRKTGGLADTVKDVKAKNGGNGFSFTEYSSDALLNTVKRGLQYYKKTGQWKNLVRNNMNIDFSWESSARHYEQLYKLAIKEKIVWVEYNN